MRGTTTTDKHDYDVIIVGGGPAGVSCAITVAKAGYSIAIVDKKPKNLIGDKTCGDAVAKAALQRVYDEIGLDLPHGDEISDKIRTMSIAAGNIDQKVSLVAPGYVVDRHKYGQRLLLDAEKLGVNIISSATVRELLIDKENGKNFLRGIKYHHNNEIFELRGKFTVDASGAYAVIRKQLHDDFLIDGITRSLQKEELWPTYREIIELKEDIPDHNFPQEIIILFKDDFFPGYFWIFSKGKRKLNCGIGWLKTQSSELGKLKTKYFEEIDNYYTKNTYRVIKKGGGQIPVRPPFDSLVFNGGALVGDAACIVHPMTAEGHGPAINTAMHLGKAIISALQSGDRRKEALWGYNMAISKHYGVKHTHAYIMREFFAKAGVNNLEYIIKKNLFEDEELDLIFSGGEIILSTLDKLKRALKLIGRPKLLWMLRQLFKSIDECELIYADYPATPEDLREWREMRNKRLKLNF